MALVAGAAFPALAQQPMGVPASSGAMNSPAAQAFKAANDKMMHGMGGPMTGDPDRDFVAGMIPHHQGAIDMADVELRYGKDPALRRLAANIIKAQKAEIAQMQSWQSKHNK